MNCREEGVGEVAGTDKVQMKVGTSKGWMSLIERVRVTLQPRKDIRLRYSQIQENLVGSHFTLNNEAMLKVIIESCISEEFVRGVAVS
jgi:hypothetical protein